MSNYNSFLCSVIALVDNSTKKDMMGEEFVTPCKWTKKTNYENKDDISRRRLLANFRFFF
jgi:hypothetical protein